jgi:lipopolysaccharide export system protein LptC
MASSLERHSRLVFWSKIILPILALAILSTIFLLARRINFDGALPYVRDQIDARANDPRMTRPDFSGMTKDGAALTVLAREARPGADSSLPTTATDLSAVYKTPGGESILVKSNAGAFDSVQGLLTLSGEARMTTPDGYDISANNMQAATNTVTITAEGNVIALAPLGQISADSMILTGPAGAHQLVFNGKVRLVYKP